MKVSLVWLGEFIDHGLDTQTLIDKLTLSGTEVKGMESVGKEFADLLVGQILEIVPHPKADRLRLATLNVGSAQSVQVVCGAPNIEVGQKIVYAPAGAWLFMSPEATVRTQLQPAVIREVESNGMICSAREMGVGTEHKSGVVILDPQCRVGEPLSTAQWMEDTIIEVEITPNRGDCLSIYGIAREISALTGKPLKKSQPLQAEAVESWVSSLSKQLADIRVQVDNSEACPHYSVLQLSEVKIQPSPLWMRWRLQNAGIRPINNLVDVTNYVMLEIGAPQHAFDRDKLRGDRLVIRNARTDESLVTLDSRTRSLSPETLVIADGETAVALAGIMGGETTEISDQTSRVVLEAAHFEPNQLRHVSTEQGLRTEASGRWEKFVDPELRLWALYRSAELLKATLEQMQQIALIDVTTGPAPEKQVTITEQKLRQLLGQDYELDAVKAWLSALGFRFLSEELQAEGWLLTVLVPTFRPDVSEAADLVEEVMRLAGLDQIGARIPAAVFPLEETHYSPDRRRDTLQLLKSLGYTEAFRYSLESDAWLGELDISMTEPLRLQNPLAEFESLRFSLLPGLLGTVRKNILRQSEISVFAEGRVFMPATDGGLPDQPVNLAGLLTRPEQALSPVWEGSESALALVKSHISALLSLFGVDQYEIKKQLPDSPLVHLYHPGRAGVLVANGQELGWLAEISPAWLHKLDVNGVRCAGFELSLSALMAMQHPVRQFVPFSVYPPILVDLSLQLPRRSVATEVIAAVQDLRMSLLTSVELIDAFEDATLAAEGNKAITLRLTFQDPSRTLEDTELTPLIEQIRQVLAESHQAIVRT